jgi:hypothetical protein
LHQAVTIVGGIDEVRLVVGSQLVARHRRCWQKEQTRFDPVHYLALLERKPGALDFARPLEGWQLPDCFGVLRRRLEGELQSGGTREYIKVLRLLESASMVQLGQAVEHALTIGASSADAVRLILEHRREQPIGLFRLTDLHLKVVPTSNLKALLSPVGAAPEASVPGGCLICSERGGPAMKNSAKAWSAQASEGVEVTNHTGECERLAQRCAGITSTSGFPVQLCSWICSIETGGRASAQGRSATVRP